MPRLFLTGATGYIGGAVLTRLLAHPLQHTFDITILVRSEEKAATFNRIFGQKHNLSAVAGSYSDLDLLKKLASNSDVVFACADADDLPAAKAILDGLRDKHSSGGSPILVHTAPIGPAGNFTVPAKFLPYGTADIPYGRNLAGTSGTGVLSDSADGMHSSQPVYSDLDIPQLETLPPSQPHRDVDRALVEADSEGYVKTFIILPSTIYGFASGPLVEAGLQNYRSQQIPRLVDVSLKRGQGGMVGKGKNVWGNVHIDDVANLYLRIFDLVAENSPPSDFAHGRAGFYFAEHGEHTLYQVGEAIAKILSGMGKGTSVPTTFTDEEIRLYFPNGTSLGSNSRCRAFRGINIGWKPAMNTQDMLYSIKAEVEAALSV